MFLPPSAPRSRPLFGLSLAAHAALVIGLVVPPLLATQDPPEPDGVVRIDFVPTRATYAPVVDKVNFLRRGIQGGGAPVPAALTSGTAPRTVLTQPPGPTDVLPPPTGQESELPIEETGERSEPGIGGPDGTNGPESGPRGARDGCDGCVPGPISALAPGVTPPVAIETVSPVYPELARRAHIEGVVTLQATIDVDGSIREVHVIRSANSLLDAAALDAVHRWRYQPASLGNRHVPVFLSVVVTFSLKNP